MDLALRARLQRFKNRSGGSCRRGPGGPRPWMPPSVGVGFSAAIAYETVERITGPVRCRRSPTDFPGHGRTSDHRSPHPAGNASLRRRTVCECASERPELPAACPRAAGRATATGRQRPRTSSSMRARNQGALRQIDTRAQLADP